MFFFTQFMAPIERIDSASIPTPLKLVVIICCLRKMWYNICLRNRLVKKILILSLNICWLTITTLFCQQWCGAAIVFWLPTLLWRGKPLPENPAGKSDDYSQDFGSGDYYDEYSNILIIII
jgi:hypothetical protein